MVDFGAMLANASEPDPIEFRELHSQLAKAPGYGKLWDVQGQVLSGWHERRDERDLVIKVNTGGGKTIDGLLILQSYINEGKGPGLYVAPNKHLVTQVLADADKLGIAVTTDVDSSAYLSSEAIGVVNAYTLVNGRTKFSDRRRARPRAPIGSVVIDDAHAAINTTRSQLALKLQENSEEYNKLLEIFEHPLRGQSVNGYLDLVDRRKGTPMRVPFWAWREKLDQVIPILRGSSGENGPLFYSWPGVQDQLLLCRVVFSDAELTITPFCPPIEHVTSFTEAKHRIFLTATLADDSVLVTDFGADSTSISNPITPLTAGDIGERMILAPQEINPSLSTDEIRREIAKLSEEHNTVVIVPSEKWAEIWHSYAETVAIGDSVELAISRLRGGQHVGLVVLVNRYDGIDLPDDACRILVLDGLPESFSPEEQIRSSLVSAGEGVDDRQVQRIEQGMGRGVRSEEDHCVVFLLGPRLAQLTVDPRTANRFSPATQAQLKLSRQVATRMANGTLEEIVRTARQALERNEQWVKLALHALRNIPPQAGSVTASAIAERCAFEYAQRGDSQGAGQIIGEVLEQHKFNNATTGALLELQASYVDMSDPVRGQHLLSQARTKNSRVLMPIGGIVYTPLAGHSVQVKKCSERLGAKFSTPSALCLEAESIIDDLVFDELRVQQFEEALRQAGYFIGLGSERPENDAGSGPDNLWALGDNTFWVIEAKSGAKSIAIGKRDVAQLAESLLWFEQRYDSEAKPVPVMVHPAVQVFADATPPPGMRVITPVKLEAFRNALRSFADAVAGADWTDTETVGRLLSGHKLAAPSLLLEYTLIQKGVRRQG